MKNKEIVLNRKELLAKIARMEKDTIREMASAVNEKCRIARMYQQFGVLEFAFEMGVISFSEMQERENNLQVIRKKLA